MSDQQQGRIAAAVEGRMFSMIFRVISVVGVPLIVSLLVWLFTSVMEHDRELAVSKAWRANSDQWRSSRVSQTDQRFVDLDKRLDWDFRTIYDALNKLEARIDKMND